MKHEIEHKFLVKPKRLPPLGSGTKIVQGYLSRSPVVRVRLSERSGRESAVLTVKGSGSRVRQEFEYRIPVGHAKALLAMCGTRIVKKRRYQRGAWEIDQFKGPLKGLWLAEIELDDEDDELPELPLWLGREVTYDRRYTNASLADAGRRPK